MQKLSAVSISIITALTCLLLVPAHAAAPTAMTATVFAQPTPDARLTPTTTTVPPSVPPSLPPRVSRDQSHRCPQFEQAFADHGLLPVEAFSYIAWRESRCRPQAINARWDSAGNIIWTLNRNGSYDSGLLQINSSWKTVTRKTCGGSIDLLLTLDCNLRVARYLLDNGGLGHWSM
jgi:hypothetical protein